MIEIRSERFIRFKDTESGIISVVKAELDCDTAADLPAADGIGGRELLMGSIAWDISTGDFYALSSEGTWYKQDGSGAYTPETPDAEPTASTLNLGKGIEIEPDITEKTTSELDILDETVFEKTAEPEEVTEIDEPVQDTEKR
jgi:hypothetical protein